jgi:tetratricopeptide (TPR) repeat protein
MATLTLPQALQRAASAYQAGALAEAEQLCRQIVAADPNYFLALFLLGASQARMGQYDRALASYDRALALQADHAETLYNRGNTLRELKRFEAALASYDRALVARPDYPEALNNRGIALQALGRLEEALASHDRAAALRGDYAEAIYNAGLTLQTQKRLDEALTRYDRALAARPDYPEALAKRGDVLADLARFDEALASYDRALALRPDDADTVNQRGIALLELKRFDEALASFERALGARPDYAEAHNNRGNALKALRRFAEARGSYERALAIRPLYAAARNNRGITFIETRRFDEAIADFHRALAIRPNFSDALFNEAMCRLLTGDFARGWGAYECRWSSTESIGVDRGFTQPMWRGEDIAGKTILLHPEQGLGDTLQFCRYAPLVAARGARVILEVQKPLRAIANTLAGPAEIVTSGQAPPPFDWHCPLLSLPLAFATRFETIPAGVPYLHPSPDAVAHWTARLGPLRRPRIGLAWSGRAQHKNDYLRSTNLRALSPLFELDATFICAQKDIRADDAAIMRERGDILDFGDELNDFTDTAALMANLDLVIAVDTSVAHLAGALGRPLWVLLPYTPDWRWLVDRDDSPWYPTARLFRQDATRDWGPVIAQVRIALGALVASQNEGLIQLR